MASACGQAGSASPRGRRTPQEPCGSPAVSSAPPHCLHAFARTLADGIVRAALREGLAEGLANAVLAAALGEASASLADLQGPGPLAPPPLPQSGLPSVGSLEYPDAPPSTPLLPELERSRRGFSRRLKGGLAREFLPPPPPPTPTPWEGAGGRGAALTETMEHVARSLGEGGPRPGGAKMAAYADQLSRGIVGWAVDQCASEVRGQAGEQGGAGDGGLHRLAGQLAQLIVTAAVQEVR